MLVNCLQAVGVDKQEKPAAAHQASALSYMQHSGICVTHSVQKAIAFKWDVHQDDNIAEPNAALLMVAFIASALQIRCLSWRCFTVGALTMVTLRGLACEGLASKKDVILNTM